MIDSGIKRRIIAISLSIIVIVSLWLPLSTFVGDGHVYAATNPTITAPSAILMDMENGQILFEQNMHDQMNPTSTTMMMTALVVLENMDIDAVVKANESIVEGFEDPIDLEPNEEITVNDLLYGMLLTSSIEAANTLAIALDGSIEKFAERMNARAALLGMEETSFKNPSGLAQEGHYTTAYDLTILARAAMKNESFRAIVGTVDYDIAKTNKSIARSIRNTNGLLYDTEREVQVQGDFRPMKFDGTTGIKNGQSDAAGSCIVATAERNGMELLVVALKAKKTFSFDDAVEAFEYGFNNFEVVSAYNQEESMANIRVTGGKEKRIDAVPEHPITAVLPIGSTAENLTVDIKPIKYIKAPVAKGDVLGIVTVSYDGVELGMSNIVASNDIPVAKLAQMFSSSGQVLSVILKIVIGIIILLLLWGIFTVIKSERNRRGRNTKKFYGTDYSSKEIRRIKRLK